MKFFLKVARTGKWSFWGSVLPASGLLLGSVLPGSGLILGSVLPGSGLLPGSVAFFWEVWSSSRQVS